MANRHYVPALDGLRAFAVALVVVHHLSYRIAPGGSIGVDVFFVMSGFLITGVLLRERERTGHISLSAFYMRRLLRLMPALVLMVGCEYAVASLLGGPGPNKPGSALFAVTYLMDGVRAFSSYSELSAVGHTWSLAVEEHFYIVWPFALLPFLTLPKRLRAPAILAVACVFALWRLWLVRHGASLDRVYYGPDARADQLLIGCALAAWLAYGPGLSVAVILGRLWPAAFPALLLIVARGETVVGMPLVQASMPDVVAILSMILILAIVLQPMASIVRIAATRPMTYVGRLSYGIYLWHWPFLIDVRYHLPESKSAALLAIFASVGAAALSYHFVEIPFLRLKRRFERGGDGGVLSESTAAPRAEPMPVLVSAMNRTA